jgi:hypothetical protein
MGPRVRGDDYGLLRFACNDGLQPNVVPAKAGTHNHRRLLEQKPLGTVPKRKAAA